MHHLIKHGYDEYATWETFNWFIDTMKPILQRYNSIRHGTPIIVPNYFESPDAAANENERMWDGIVNRMIELLDLMDEDNPKYDDMDWKQEETEMQAAKDEFFKLFSEYFYCLWD
jgi:hypothetical protein